MGISKESEDALAITKWKLPGQVQANFLLPLIVLSRLEQQAISGEDALVNACFVKGY